MDKSALKQMSISISSKDKIWSNTIIQLSLEEQELEFHLLKPYFNSNIIQYTL